MEVKTKRIETLPETISLQDWADIIEPVTFTEKPVTSEVNYFLDDLTKNSRIKIGKELLLGTDNACDYIILNEPTISAAHARIRIQDDRILLEDLNSTNHIYLKEGPIKETYELKPNERFRLANSRYFAVNAIESEETNLSVYENTGILDPKSSSLFLMIENAPLYIVQDGKEVHFSFDQNSAAIGKILFDKNTHRFEITPFEKNVVCLESGQPLGRRAYQLPDTLKIQILGIPFILYDGSAKD